MSEKQIKPLTTVLSAAVATGAGSVLDVRDYQIVSIQYSAEGTANSTTKFQGSLSEEAPTFSSAQTSANHWDYVEVVDLEDGTAIDGDTGIVVTSDDFRNLAINVDQLNWITANVTARSGGSVTVKLTATTEE
jgi:hypothetical protein